MNNQQEQQTTLSRMAFHPDYELRELPCAVCGAKACTAWVPKEWKDGDLPDFICKGLKGKGSCEKKYEAELVQIPRKKLQKTPEIAEKKPRKVRKPKNDDGGVPKAEEMMGESPIVR